MSFRSSRRRCIFSAVGLAGAVASCASIPGTPGGPLQRAGVVQVSETQIYDVSRIDITTIDGSKQGFTPDGGGPPNPGVSLLVPLRLGGRVAITDWLDTAADWNLSVSGAEIRAGLPEGTRRFPFAFLLAARTDALALNPAGGRRGQQHELRFRLEGYPALSSPSEASPTRVHGVLALGGSLGRHYHDFTVHYEAPLMRDEDRIEGAVGVEVRHGHFVGSLVTMPYVVAHAGPITPLECSFGDCMTSTVRSYQQDFGISIALTLGIAVNQRSPVPPPLDSR